MHEDSREGGMGIPSLSAQQEVEAILKRQQRKMRHAWAEGYLTAVCAMLKPGDLALDLGANMGVVTTRLAETGADVIAYEPDPFAFKTLTAKFSDIENVTLINAAVGIGSGRVRLMRGASFAANPESDSVKSTIVAGGRGTDDAHSVEVQLLDFPTLLNDLCRNRAEVAFVKMDIEGAELAILEEMHKEKLFGKVRCLVAETHEHKFKDLRKRYRALRAELAAHYPEGRVNLDWI